MSGEYTLPKGAQIGHVHLTVSNLERSIEFYRDILGFELQVRYGNSVAFLSAGGYHHHVALNTWAGEGAPQPPEGTTGLYHFAIRLPSRKELARVVKRVIEHGIELQGATDHGVSESVYLRDPDGNGIELMRDREPEEWPRDEEGSVAFTNSPLDVEGLMAQLDA